MPLNEFILILLLYGLLFVSLIIMGYIYNEHFKKKTNESLVIIIIISILIILLIPIILGVTIDLNF